MHIPWPTYNFVASLACLYGLRIDSRVTLLVLIVGFFSWIY